jgi:hypothetical protein
MPYDDDVDCISKTEKEIDNLIKKNNRLFERATSADMSIEHKKMFGICGTCKNLWFAESEFNVLFAKCNVFDVMIHRKQPIVNCSSYEEIGSMTLWDMKQCATILDLNKKTMGFIIPTDRT